ncbi:hypothetical protein RCH27_08875 [Paracidovorax citrulli]|uniref:hypothetical protein n=1 Tax=Paracidovorax citrulli TaxID=80869 RepID=UPI003A7F75DB
MKERPILFSAPMVRALLAGSKTQTRRPLKPQPAPNHPHDGGTKWVLKDGLHVPVGSVGHLSVREKQGLRCPYGQPGDRLWVREAWRTVAEADALPPRDLNEAHRIWNEADAPHQPGAGKLRPGMFMPRWASRTILDVTAVRVERLQDISDEDCVAEGCGATKDAIGVHFTTPPAETIPRGMFRDLWESINGPGSWDANPWVWAVTFSPASLVNT